MPIDVYEGHTDSYTRYLLLFNDAPALTDIRGLIEHHDDEGLLGIVVLTRDGSTAPVQVESDGDGKWYVYVVDATGDADEIEIIGLYDDGSAWKRSVYVNGFTTDRVPGFIAGVNC